MTDTFPLITKQRVVGQPLNIPLMYNLVRWNNFLKKYPVNTTILTILFTKL